MQNQILKCMWDNKSIVQLVYVFTVLRFIFSDYVDEIFTTICSSIKTKALKKAREELKTMTPPAMNTMLEKQPKSEAIKKREERRLM